MTEPELADVYATSERLTKMHAEIVKEVNDLFAVLGDIADGDEQAGLVRFAERMQDQRDAARTERDILVQKHQDALREKAEAIAGNVPSADAADLINALKMREAARELRNCAHKVETNLSTSAQKQELERAVRNFDTTTAGMMT